MTEFVQPADPNIRTKDSLLLRLVQEHQNRLTSTETKIASYLLDHYPDVVFETIATVGDRSGTSPPSVMRFVAKLGFSGYSDFQDALRDELSARLRSPLSRLQAERRESPAGIRILDETLHTDIGNIERTFREIRPDFFEKVVEELSSDLGTVYVMGEKKAFSLAHYFTTQLNYLRPNVRLIVSSDSLIGDILADLQPHDLLASFLFRRYPRSQVRVSELFHEVGAKILMVSETHVLPHSVAADFHCAVAVRGVSLFDSYTAAFSLVNGILSAVAQRRHEKAAGRLDRMERLWKRFDIFLETDS